MLCSIVLLLLLSPSRCQLACENMFLVEPNTVTGSPIGCNMLMARVELRCTISGSASVGWFHTTERNRAGAGVAASDGQILHAPPLFVITNSAMPSVATSVLAIPSYNSSFEGFYWCGAARVSGGALSFNPSRVVHLRTTYTTAQLEPCSADTSPTSIVLTGVGERCAFGEAEPSPSIVIGAEFTNITILTTTMEMTTEPVTTADATTLAATTEVETTTPTEDVGGMETTTESDDGSSSSSVVRSALIWFSVGAAVFVLLTCGTIMCIIALTKC